MRNEQVIGSSPMTGSIFFVLIPNGSHTWKLTECNNVNFIFRRVGITGELL